MHSQTPLPENKFALVYCVDETMLPMALFSAQDALNNSRNRAFDIVICSLDPLELPESLTSLDIRFEHLPLRDTIEGLNLPLGGWLPVTTYMRLWLCQHFADRYERLLYLDADTTVPGERISSLFHLDLHQNPVAATRDVLQWRRPDRGIHDFDVRNMHGHAYLNAGVTLFDVPRFNHLKCLERMLAFVAQDRNILHHDQSLLNLVLLDERAELGPDWNWQWTRDLPYFSEKTQPQIIHFCGYPKPWVPEGARYYPAELQTRYATFFATHFPHLAFTPLTGREARLPLWKRALVVLDHLRHLPAYRRLRRRFPDETVVR
ncbi:glycosyltransferase [Pelagimonas sp. KU-00592-HH]|uniref:glycosyltransferase family 8 protein n=1 Tax=Pelagimonas sp. KU-00592-HH TaxID=3127651 RepID=UPI0031024B02